MSGRSRVEGKPCTVLAIIYIHRFTYQTLPQGFFFDCVWHLTWYKRTLQMLQKFLQKNESGFAPLQIRPLQIRPVPIEFASFVTSSPPDISSIISPLYLIEFAPIYLILFDRVVIAFIHLVAPKGAVWSCTSATSNTTVRPTGIICRVDHTGMRRPVGAACSSSRLTCIPPTG